MVGKKLIPLTPDDFKINQLVEIIVNEEEYKGVYRSRIEEVNDTTLTLAMPFYRGQIVPLRPGLNIKVSFSKEGTAYVFETTILKRVWTPLPLLIVEKPVEAERRQRRRGCGLSLAFQSSIDAGNWETACKRIVILPPNLQKPAPLI